MKAFLSHSSYDKEFVRAVAKELTRLYCVFDERTFENGDAFKGSIERGLDESSVFVLFASKRSLESLWVTFEIEEAWYRRLRGVLSKSLVYIIDSSVQIDDLPEWLRRAKASRANAAKSVAREIQHHVGEMLRQRRHPHFIGRAQKLDELQDALAPIDGSPPPQSLFISGLPGIGRRTLAKRGVSGTLNLQRIIEIRVQEGDSINDICITVADQVEPYSTTEGLRRIVDHIQTLSDEESLDRLCVNIEKLVGLGELPLFFDEGGLLDEEGFLRAPIRQLVTALPRYDDAYTMLVSHRRPRQEDGLETPSVRVDPLNTLETKRLMAVLGRQHDLTISPTQLDELAEYVAGYPPSAYFCIQQAKEYGIALVLSHKHQLVKFGAGIFLKHFAKISLSAEEQTVLRLLALYSPLPLAVLSSVTGTRDGALSTMLVRLIDLSLVTPTGQGNYRIADPVANAALSAFGWLNIEQSRKVAQSLLSYLDKTEAAIPRLELSRVLFLAAGLAGDASTRDGAVRLASDLIKLTVEFYHDRRYDQAIQMGQQAILERPHSISARGYLIRALIQREKWELAEGELSKLQEFAPPREVTFLRGFFEKRRKNTKEAIKQYEASFRLGRRGAAISRELAHCYLIQGNPDEASKHIRQAMLKHGDNRYVVDLAVQIATQRRDEPAARTALARLKLVDEPEFYLHRLSRVEMAFGKTREARDAALGALEKCSRSVPFEILAQLAYCEIEMRNWASAQDHLDALDKEHRGVRRDIRVALRCRLEIARGHFKDALAQGERIADRTTAYFKRIRRDGIRGELETSVLPDLQREQYESELAELDADPALAAFEEFLPEG